METSIRTGMNDVLTMEVTKNMLAQTTGSADIAVLSTSMLINTIETLCSKMLKENLLDENLTSVGATINVKHISPTPNGMSIKAKATVLSVDRNKVIFKAQVWDQNDLICTGIHNRIIVDREEFENQAKNKLRKIVK